MFSAGIIAEPFYKMRASELHFNKQPLGNERAYASPIEIMKSKDGTLWLIFQTYILQKKGNQITRYELPIKAGKYGSSKTVIKSIEYQSLIIFSYKSILLTYDQQKDTLVEWKKLEYENDVITDLLVSRDGKLWVSSLNSVQFINNTEDEFVSIDGLKNSLSNSLFEDSEGNLWVGTYLATLFKIYNHIDPHNNAMVEMHQLSQSEPMQVNNIKQIDSDELILGTSFGLFRFILKTKQIKKIDTPDSINSVQNLILQETKLWIHANDKIFLQDRLSKQYSTIDLKLDMEQETNEPRVKSMYIDNEAMIWTSLHNSGLYTYSKFRNKFAQLTIYPKTNLGRNISFFQPISSDQFLIGNGLKTFLSTRQDGLGFNTTAFNYADSEYLSIASGKDVYFIRKDTIKKMSLPGRYFSDINSMTVINNYLWITTELEGLRKFQIEENSLVNMAVTGVPTEKIIYVSQTAKGRVVLVFPSSIEIYQDTDSSLELIEKISLSYEIVKIEEKQGFIFSHLSDRSISRFNLNDRSISNHSFKIPDIGCVINDGSNIWWLGQIDGSVFRVDNINKTLKQYGSEDGIPVGGLSGEVCQRENGFLYFSSYEGLIRTTSNIDLMNNVKPMVNLLSTPVLKQHSELTPEDFPLDFFIFQSSLVSPTNNTLQYRLSPNNKVWEIANQNDLKLNYQNLEPGKYTFSYRASNNHEVQSDIKSVQFTVLPPLWLTWWAKLFYFAVLILSIWLLFKARLSVVKSKSSELEIAISARTKELSNEKAIVDSLLREKQVEISNLSHEFRTPLTLILGPINQLLKKEGVFRESEESNAKTKLTLVKNNARRLLKMVEQLMQLELFKLNRIARNKKQDSYSIINFILDSFQQLAKEKGVILIKGEVARTTITFASDALEKILINLISNAIKYTPSNGKVFVQSQIIDEEFLEITVSDTGVGIAENMKVRVFDRFQRAVGEENSRIEGAGIGLALVKELVESHSGKVKLTSELNLGTEIVVTLPIKNGSDTCFDEDEQSMMNSDFIKGEIDEFSVETIVEAPINIEHRENKNLILVVEDNFEMSNYIIEELEQNYSCVKAFDGNIGFELAKKLIPDLIISDVMMPNMNGLDLTNMLKNDPRTNHIPVILLTALSEQSNRIQGLDAKADEYLTKPFDTEELSIKVANLIEVRNILKSKFMGTLFTKQTTSSGEANDKLIQQNQGKDFVDKLDAIVSEIYKNPEIKVADIASRMFMSQRQLLRKFNGVLDISPTEYLRRYRLERAKELIINGMSPGSVALEVGFSSHTHFGKCFKAQFGCAPSSYEE